MEYTGPQVHGIQACSFLCRCCPALSCSSAGYLNAIFLMLLVFIDITEVIPGISASFFQELLQPGLSFRIALSIPSLRRNSAQADLFSFAQTIRSSAHSWRASSETVREPAFYLLPLSGIAMSSAARSTSMFCISCSF